MPANATVRQGANSDYRGLNILNLGVGSQAIPDLAAFLQTLAKVGPDGRLVANTGPAAGFGLTYNAATNAYEFNDNALNFGQSFPNKRIDPTTGKMVTAAGYTTFDYVRVTQGTYYRSDELLQYYGAFYSGQGEVYYVRAWNLDPSGAPLASQTTLTPTLPSANTQMYLRISILTSDIQFLHIAPTQGYNDSDIKLRLGLTTAADPAPQKSTVLLKANNLSDLTDKAASRKNLGITDANDKIPAILLPAGIDDIQEFDGGVAAFPATGERGVIYVDTSGAGSGYVQYRWSGTQYGVIPVGAGTTDAVTEGAINKYFTQARAIGSLLTGYAKAAASRAIAATDSIAIAIGILEKKADDNSAAIDGIKSLIPANATNANQLATKADLPSAQSVKVTPYNEQDVVGINHNLGRWAIVQIYESDGFGTDAQVQQVDLNNVVVRFGTPGSGQILTF